MSGVVCAMRFLLRAVAGLEGTILAVGAHIRFGISECLLFLPFLLLQLLQRAPIFRGLRSLPAALLCQFELSFIDLSTYSRNQAVAGQALEL